MEEQSKNADIDDLEYDCGKVLFSFGDDSHSMSAESPRHVRSGGPLIVPSQPPSDRSIIDAVSGFINDVTLSSSSTVDPKDVIQWARFESADINEPRPEGDSDSDLSPLLLILGYGAGVQCWLIPPSGEAQEVLSWRQGTVRVLRILPTPQHGDCFASKRPLIALCDSASPGPTFCSLSFISIRGGEQVKSIKFKNPILDVLANKRSVVISFSERFAVFDAATLEDRMSVTTCYPCPCPLGGSLPVNPLALGDRWLAYADKKLNQSKRSSGGCEGEGVTSYTATVLHAAKSLSKGLRGLGESVAHSLAGGRSTSQSPSPPNTDIQQPGVITILDIEGNEEEDGQDNEEPFDPIVAHFVAHSEAIIALKFDASGMLLVTADRRGHDFHVFRINPHPFGPSLASVHHLYILHRGDTTAKVQDMAISCDSRWAAVSTLRGTTHVFAISPYGGVCGVRTHTAPRVVNRLSRFHRSAGLPIHAAAKRASPSAVADSMAQGAWYPNPRLPPYPLPTTVSPLAQLRPTANIPTHTITRTSSGRQRLSSLSEDSNAAPLLARARFGPPPVGCARAPAPVASLYLMAANGALLHLLLHPKPMSSIPKEKISDDSNIELEVSSVAQWPLQRPAAAADLLAPLPPSNPLLQPQTSRRCPDICMSEEERWLSQVEIVTHAGPHRRLWMGPQFVFKTYNCTGSSSSLSEAETVEVDAGGPARSNPVNMPGVRPVVPVLIDSGSASSLEHSPSDSFRRKSLLAETGRAPSVCDVQLREDLAEAMKEDHGAAIARSTDARKSERAWTVDPLGCVVQPAPTAPVEPVELYASSNCDEATFRPVLRAPAPLAARPEAAALALPLTTTIPVQSVAPPQSLHTPPDAQPLPTAVVIPAALSELEHCNLDISVSEEVREKMHARQNIRESASAERESERPPETLPKSRMSGDIHPTVESRVKISPTPKSDSDKVAGDDSNKNSKSRVRGSSRSQDFGELARASTLTKIEPQQDLESSLKVEKFKNIEPEVPLKVEHEKKVESEFSITVEKPKKVESVKAEKAKTEPVSKESVIKECTISQTIIAKSIRGASIPKESTSKDAINKKPISKDSVGIESIFNDSGIVTDTPEETSSICAPLKLSNKNKSDRKILKEKVEKKDVSKDDIKTEEQAWDMLWHVSEKTISRSSLPPVDDKVNEEIKPKSKRIRKGRKPQEDFHAKEEEDTFVEIHAIEDKQQQPSGELVEISTPYEELEPVSYLAKAKKARSPKSVTPERKIIFEAKDKHIWGLETEITTAPKYNRNDDNVSDVAFIPKSNIKAKPKVKEPDALQIDSLKVIDVDSECSVSVIDSAKPKKSKSPSPYSDRKLEKRYDNEVKDVYVIDTMKDEFPEIQITKGVLPGTKTRKKSLQPGASQEVEVIEKPIKSWSSIAASKSNKKEEIPIENPILLENKEDKTKKVSDVLDVEEETGSISKVSLQEKLIELCKRTDIMVAECDAPTELNFVDEHHSILDIPTLEPLGFGLDGFKLEVMHDSLLDVGDSKITSPICKLDIDSILSTMNEATSKTVMTSAFNLIDLEKMPVKKERGFNVVENDKITSQEVKVDDDKFEDQDVEVMEKSSDDDNASPVVSTDSDKEEKKSTGASNVTMPFTKQSSKSKKSPITTGGRYEPEQEELSSSSFSSTSRASLDPPSSPTPSCGGDNQLHFPGDSSSSV
ncbi:unnamed protein product [Arctia plantaginis]|uniref:BCAS3 WD40 domain-containing protein n=1 Tax=Arctia plantaginis TaxID=874455 RepID=A0A8S0ZAE6_ARCPL|nr:unnamed protein product [Arctia plantaginis]